MKRRNLYFMPCLFAALALFLVSCNKDDSESYALTIKATDVINGSDQITTVKAGRYWVDYVDGSEYDFFDVIAEAPYKNNGFTLNFPNNPPAKFLELIEDEFDYMDDIAISDKKTKFFGFDGIMAYNKNDDEIGDFFLGSDNGEHFIGWIYVDRDVTVEGKYEDSYDYEEIDCNFKKGWNIVYVNDSETYNSSTGRKKYYFSITSKIPSGVKYNWYFISYDNLKSTQADTKATIKKDSFFPKSKGIRKNNRIK